MSTNDQHSFSSIGAYAPPLDSLSTMLALIDDNENNVSSSFTNLIHIMENSSHARNVSNETNDWSVHSPETRTIFYELRLKLKDIESIYKKDDTTTEENVIPTTETIENTKKLEEIVDFFKEKIEIYFNKFIESQKQFENEEAFLSKCSSIVDFIQNPCCEEQDFNECASSICKTLENFIEKKNGTISQTKKTRDIYWSQFKQYRDACKLVKEIQSDIICQICMAEEVNMALNCGHSFCTTCASRCNVCPNCRISVTQKLKLYF